MFGFPRRKSSSRRIAAIQTLFDPSTDSACTGWWRTDSGVQVTDTVNQLATGWTSKLPDQLSLANAGSEPWLYIPNSTNGFPMLLGLNGDYWTAQGLIENGDTAFTTTFVFRALRRYDGQAFLIRFGDALVQGIYGNSMRAYLYNLGWWDVENAIWLPYGMNRVSVMTMSYGPRDPADGTRDQYFYFDNQAQGPFNVSGSNMPAVSETTPLYVYGFQGSPIGWLEIITWRRRLATSEIADAHTALLQQYGVTG